MKDEYRIPSPDDLKTPQDIEAAYDKFRVHVVESASLKTRLEAAQLVGVTDESNILRVLGSLQQIWWLTLDGTPQNKTFEVAVSMATLRAKTYYGLGEEEIRRAIREANERAAIERTSMEWR